ncbi:unnamed protein product [Brassica oleracea var. botrytis]
MHGENCASCKFHFGDSPTGHTENVGNVAHVSPEGNPSKKARNA